MISLNYRDSRPIYEQIKDSIRNLVISGALAPGDKLPSVREQAGKLAINPNTIQRAYRELEAEGYIYSVSGKGSFAAGGQDIGAGRKNELIKTLNDTLEELRFFGMTDEELVKMIREG